LFPADITGDYDPAIEYVSLDILGVGLQTKLNNYPDSALVDIIGLIF
jgi:hypothetical protein